MNATLKTLLESLDTPETPRRLLFLGGSGAGKSTLVRELAAHLEACAVLNLDPGLSTWGPPTCITLVEVQGESHLRRSLSCVGSLNPVRHQGRFIAESVSMVRRLPDNVPVLIDAPGVIRGSVAVELIEALLTAVLPTHVVLLGDNEDTRAVLSQLHGRSLEVITLASHVEAQPLTRGARRAQRQAAWEAAIEGAEPLEISLSEVRLRGFPPREGEVWEHRLVAVLDSARATLGLGEVDTHTADALLLNVRWLSGRQPFHALYVTDTHRDRRGRVTTVPPSRSKPRPRASAWTMPDRDTTSVPVAWPEAQGRAPYRPMLLNPLFGDPALLLREQRGSRGLLFDIGWLEPLPSKLLGGVSDLFVSHAHMDHLQGFVKLIRLLLGPSGRVRIYGPPGIDARIESLIGGFDFNLIGSDGPIFELHVLEGEQIRYRRLRLSATTVVEHEELRPVHHGLILEEEGLRVRAATMMHSIPVLGFRVEMLERVRPHRSFQAAPPRPYTMAYITDIADSPHNRATALELASGADLLVCESMFAQADADRAGVTAHLTTRACAEIARDADVAQLVPFHFSPRYSDAPSVLYDEIAAIFPRVLRAV